MIPIVNIFEPIVFLNNYKLETNLNEIPNHNDLINKLSNYFNENPNNRYLFQMNIKSEFNDLLQKNLNPDTIYHLKSFVFNINETQIKSIYNSIYETYISEINNIIFDAYADLSMYPPDDYNYQMSYLLIEQAESLKQKIFQKIT